MFSRNGTKNLKIGGRRNPTLMRPIAIFRFSPTEGPAYFADWLDAHGVAWQLVPLDEGVPVPEDPSAFAGIGMMGGPMSVNDPLPWIAPIGALLRAAVDARVPVIGHCLGGQLLAQALGAPVMRAMAPEIGWHDVDTCDGAAQRAWFGGRPAFTTFEWHYDTFAPPRGSTRVLTNAHNVDQAYVIDDRHIGFQCHIEMTRQLTETWLASGADELPAQSKDAVQSAADIRRDLDGRIASLHGIADDVYARWAQGLVG
jgi:GMP synthase-like glutamine amidotransferase